MRNDYSVGGVVLDEHGRVAVIQTLSLLGETVWGLPKGHPKEREEPRETARREVREETGLRAEVLGRQPAGTVEYTFTAKDGERVTKRVDFYLMRATGGDPADHDGEVLEVALLPPADARARLSYENERNLLDAVLAG